MRVSVLTCIYGTCIIATLFQDREAMLNNFYAGGVNNGGWGRYGKERKIFIKSPNGLFMI
jgi:hypothetical protein